uniref:Uncharacterized protein n=1 Tax=Pyrodinium bahamense TaxID=73915 RepID=A0A7R9ZZW8_9DINO
MDAYRAAKNRFSKRWDDYPGPEGKAGQMKCGCEEGTEEDAPYFHRLQWDLANSYYWTGEYMSDFVFFVKQWHPLIGMFLCHPNHPWDKKERLMMFLASLALTMVPSAYIADKHPDHKQVWTVFLISIPDTIAGVVLYQLSILETRGFCRMCACCWQVFTHANILCLLAVGALATYLSYRALGPDVHWSEMLKPLIIGKAISYLAWFPLWWLLPCQLGFRSLWNYEQAEEAKRRQGSMRASSYVGRTGEEWRTCRSCSTGCAIQ